MSLPGARTRYDWRPGAIAGIPITFSAWYLLLVWACLARAGAIEIGLVHLVAVTISVLVHELGHGLVAKRYRLKPSILLHGFGGWCEHEEAYRRDEALKVVAAGPGAGLALGAIAWALQHGLREAPWWLDLMLRDLAWMGLFWSLVNLLPILPMDGGAILENLLERRRSITFPKRTTRKVGVFVAALAAVAALWVGEITLVLLMLLLAWNNASAVGILPSIPGMSMVAPADRRAAAGPVRAWWRPGPGVGALLAVMAVPIALSAFVDVEGAVGGALSLRSDAAPQLWRLLTYPWVPAGPPMTLISALLALWLTGPALERRRGPRGVLLLAAVAILGAGLAGMAAGAALPGVVAGPVPLVLAFLAAWAYLSRGAALGPNAVLPVRPPLVLFVVVLIDLGDRWWSGDAMGAAAHVASVAIGLAFAATSASPRALWHRLVLWWKLRNPPPVQIGSNRPR